MSFQYLLKNICACHCFCCVDGKSGILIRDCRFHVSLEDNSGNMKSLMFKLWRKVLATFYRVANQRCVKNNFG